MSFRFGAVWALALALALGACASAGNGDGAMQTGVTTQQFDEEDLPQWVEDLPEGTPPRDDEHTDGAFLALAQGMGASGEAAREYFLRALEHAEAGMAADPENPQPYFQAGDAHLRLGNLEEAARMFDRAEEIYPRYILETEMLREEAWIDLFNEGAEHYREGNPEAALPYFERAHLIFQGRPEAMLNLAEIYSAQERLNEAVELYLQALDVMTTDRAAEMDEEFQQQWAEFKEIARFNAAQLLFRTERYSEAADIYQVLLEDDPENLDILSNLAVALVSSGREEEAMELYDRLLGRPDLDAQDFYMIGVGLYQVEEWEQSARAFAETWERVPGHRDALFNYAQTLYLAEDWEALVEIADDLIEADPHNQNAYRFKAQSLVQLDRQQEAVPVLEQMEARPFFVEQLELHPMQGGVAVLGFVINRTQAPGSTVDLDFTFWDIEGSSAGSAQTSVTVGEPGEPVQFQADLATSALVFGFSYEAR
jgi:tetratricopeptide (TPR) repeat protein